MRPFLHARQCCKAATASDLGFAVLLEGHSLAPEVAFSKLRGTVNGPRWAVQVQPRAKTLVVAKTHREDSLSFLI